MKDLQFLKLEGSSVRDLSPLSKLNGLVVVAAPTSASRALVEAILLANPEIKLTFED